MFRVYLTDSLQALIRQRSHATASLSGPNMLDPISTNPLPRRIGNQVWVSTIRIRIRSPDVGVEAVWETGLKLLRR